MRADVHAGPLGLPENLAGLSEPAATAQVGLGHVDFAACDQIMKAPSGRFLFARGQAEEQIGHHGPHYIAFFGTLFVFILFMNLIGVIPSFESPTMSPAVPLGCAIATFLYYNMVGIQANGVGRYLAHFAGPMPWLAPLMVPIELISHLARPLSLTIRLFANMFAGEQVTLVFISLTYFLVPVAFMGLHIFVSLLQAYIFMLLAMMYVAGATAHEH